IILVKIAGRPGRCFYDSGIVLGRLLARIKSERIAVVASPVGNDGGIGEQAGIVGIGLHKVLQNAKRALRVTGSRLPNGGFPRRVWSRWRSRPTSRTRKNKQEHYKGI